MMKKITLLILLLLGVSLEMSAQVSFAIDYDSYDAFDATNNGYGYQGPFIWSLNNTEMTASGNRNMTWAMVDFNEMIDVFNTNGPFTYPSNGSYIVHLDSVRVYYNFDNSQNKNHLLKMGVYLFNDIPRESNGLFVAAAVETDPTNGLTSLFSQTIDTSDLISGATINNYLFTPDVDITGGAPFSIYLESEGDTLNDFNILAGYRENCNDAEFANSSIVELNSQAYGNFLGNPNIIGQQYSYGTFACNSSLRQNFLVVSYVTVTSTSFALEITDNYIGTAASNGGCAGETVKLSANFIGNNGPVTISWTPTTDLSDPTISNPIATIGDDDVTYHVVITDSVGNVREDSIVVQSFQMQAIAGPDVSLQCGQTSSIVPSATSSIVGIPNIFSWSNGGGNGTLEVNHSGIYTLTVTNGVGCVATDEVEITVADENAVNFTFDNPVCKDVPAKFTNTSQYTSGWNFEWQLNSGQKNEGDADYTFNFISAGTKTITIYGTKVGNSSCVWSKSRSVNVLETGCGTAINELGLEGLNISPNPSNGIFTVSFEMENNNDVEISLNSIDGKIIETQSFDTNKVNATFNGSKLASGLYIVKIKTNEGVTTKNVVISNN